MRKMYKQPTTDVQHLKGVNLMLTTSEAGGDGPGGQTGNDAPAVRGEIIP